jgi:hypothetical protein
MSDQSRYQGMAALTICESLLLTLNDQKILPESDIIGILSMIPGRSGGRLS